MSKNLLSTIVLVGAGFIFATPGAYATEGRAPEIKVFGGVAMEKEFSWLAFDKGFHGGATVATGDVDGDGIKEIIIGAGPGGGPQVRILRQDGSLVRQFFVYPESFRGGVKVASCDFNNDGRFEILTGSGQGGGPHVRVLNQFGQPLFTPGFFAYHTDFRGGVNIACGDVDADGVAEIVTGVGVGAEPHVRVFSRYGNTENVEIFPYAKRDQGGVHVAVAEVDGGAAEIVTSIYRFGRSLVKVYRTDSSRSIVGQFEGWPETVQSGFHVAAGDVDHDGYDEIVVSIAAGGGPQVRVFEAYGKPLSQNFFAYESEFRGGVYTAVGDVDGDGQTEIITAPGRNTIQGHTDLRKYIEVKLSEQRLYAYENGIIENTFLISSGLDKYPTPEGDFSVTAKIPTKDYEWTYGPDHPDNYDLEDVDFNLRFAPTYYLHYAYWHNNFGNKMSHGCVNIDRTNAEWIYNWADVGTPVIVHQ
ncbi:MAG: L,D-transpeptidase family protein [bacterium]|nr:L,D-transpeptidase family protein [bacterium]